MTINFAKIRQNVSMPKSYYSENYLLSTSENYLYSKFTTYDEKLLIYDYNKLSFTDFLTTFLREVKRFCLCHQEIAELTVVPV